MTPTGVAGASRGVGRGIAGAIDALGGRAVPVPCDLADDAAVEAARLVTSFEAAEPYGFTDVAGRRPDPL